MSNVFFTIVYKTNDFIGFTVSGNIVKKLKPGQHFSRRVKPQAGIFPVVTIGFQNLLYILNRLLCVASSLFWPEAFELMMPMTSVLLHVIR